MFKNGLEQYIADNNNEDESYQDIKCYSVCFSENERNYIGLPLDSNIGNHLFRLTDN